MAQIVVGIGECGVSSEPDSTLVTYGLGSCIAVAAWDPDARAAAMLHYMFPDSTVEPGRSRDNPWLFGDTGIAAMLDRLSRKGSASGRLVLRAAGGASVMQGPSMFNVGERNRESLRSVLSKAGLRLESEDIGGNLSRNLRLDVTTGRCWVERQGQVVELGLSAAPRRRSR